MQRDGLVDGEVGEEEEPWVDLLLERAAAADAAQRQRASQGSATLGVKRRSAGYPPVSGSAQRQRVQSTANSAAGTSGSKCAGSAKNGEEA